MADGTITIKVIADTAKAIAGLEEVKALGHKMGSTIGSATKAGARMAAAAVATAATAIGAGLTTVTKQALDLYTAYEQLAGGTELLFGDSSDKVMKYAEEAYKNVQMSVNDYLQTANYYATGLKEALGGDTDAAAELANGIITAQADIVAATGASSELVSNAFQGVMRGNYTMLDNLGLGIKGTQEGMQEVIDKMNKLNGTKYEMGNFADMEKALIDYVKYAGMAGYATAEAKDTIEGSVAMAKAAWTNWLTGLGDDTADMDQLTNDLVDSLTTAAERIVPRIGEIVGALAEYGPEALQELITAIQDEASNVDFEQTGADILNALSEAIRKADISGNIKNILEDMKKAFSGEASSPMAEAAKSLADALLTELGNIIGDPANWANVLTIIGSMLTTLVDSAWNNTLGGVFGAYLDDGNVVSTKPGTTGLRRGHAVGGIFNSATVLNGKDEIGEAGMELLQPLNKATYEMMGAGIAANLRSEPIDYEAMGRAMCAAVSGMGFYVGDQKLAHATRSSRDRIDGRTAVLARRGVDAG